MALHRFVVAVRYAITAHALLPGQGSVVVACSGGADSLALLHALHQLCNGEKPVFPGVTLHVAHLDHGLRGAESAADAAFVAAESARLGLSFTGGLVTAEERSTWRGSVEAAARAARYAFLRQVALEVGANRIAVGHTADDQAETILFHLIRGSGVEGLAGMRHHTQDIVRPLLDIWRADTEGFCRDLGLAPRMDASNDDPRYTRNRIRHELVPLLESLHPGVRHTLVRNGTIFAHIGDYLAEATDAAWAAVFVANVAATDCREDPPAFGLDRAALRHLAPALRQQVLRRAIARLGSTQADGQVTADSVARLARVVVDHSGEPRLVQFATGGSACVSRNVVSFYRVNSEVPNPPPEETVVHEPTC